MIPDDYKTSLLIPQQLPEFVRDNVSYETFVTFLQAYYEWLETANTANGSILTANTSGEGVTYGTKNLLNYMDVDETLDGFVEYFIRDFLPYIPKNTVTDRRKLLKIAKDFYLTKGTTKSYQFLFRALYDSDAETFNTSDVILRASDGKWIISKSLRINSTNSNFLKINNLRLFGETSRSYATVDFASVTGNKTEIFISNIIRLFESGEFIRVVDSNNLDVYFFNNEVYIQNQGVVIPNGATTLRGKVVGLISSIKINPKNRGQFYEVGDPVIVNDGLSPDVANPIGATAIVGETTLGSIQSLSVSNPSHGYRVFPNTTITFTGGGGSGATAQVTLIDGDKLANVNLITSNTLGIVSNVVIGNANNVVNYVNFAVAANTNSSLLSVLTFKTFTVGPIASVNILNQGGGYSSLPVITLASNYATDVGIDNFKFLGILQPITILNGGQNYLSNNTIQILGGTGAGAFANLTVNAGGSIISAQYVNSSNNMVQLYPLGGLGYLPGSLPTINIATSTGSNASLVINGIMGDGAVLTATTDRVGAITKITIIDPGEDYVSTPSVSLKIADLSVSNVSTSLFPSKGDIVYQGATLNTASYKANVDSIFKLTTSSPANTFADIYQVRTFNYSGNYNAAQSLFINKDISGVINLIKLDPQNFYTDITGPTSIIRYGDGNAKANASFLDGLIIGEGKYLNDDGHLSSLGRVLESLDYNNFTYVLSVEQALKTYKDLVLNLVHPLGMNLKGRYLLKSANGFNMITESSFQEGYHMDTFAGPSTLARIEANTSIGQVSTNIIRFVNTITANIGNTIFANDIIEFTATNNLRAYSTITNVDWANNRVIIQDNVFVIFANVATGSANASSNVINIKTVTGQYDGNFLNKTKSNNIIFVGDAVSLNGGPYYSVTQVFANGNIFVANNTFGPIDNAFITVNKSANTDTALVYGVIQPHDYSDLITESGYILITESGFTIQAG